MEQSAELRDLTLRFYQAMASGDIGAIERLVSRRDGVLAIGTDPKEWWPGHATITGAFKAQMEEMGGSLPVVAGDPQAYSEGSAGWVADRPKFSLPDGTEIPFRVTAGFHKEDGAWKFVLFHASIGVDNEEVIGEELTT